MHSLKVDIRNCYVLACGGSQKGGFGRDSPTPG